jgi:hypothetical protein
MKLNKGEIMKCIVRTMALMLFFMFIVITSASGGDFQLWRKDVACGHKLPEAERVAISGFEKSYCIQISKSSRICAGMKTPDSVVAQIFYERDGSIIQQWDAPIDTFLSESGLRVDTINMTGDGEGELIVGLMNSQSMGIAIQQWTIWAITGNTVSKPVKVDDYGIMSFLTKSNQSGKWYLLSTRWRDGWEPKRGDGLYAVGKWYELSGGEFAPVSDRPQIQRRYLPSLERIRLHAFEQKKPTPVIWYKDKRTRPIVGQQPLLKKLDE